MGVKDNVFASRSERQNFYKLSRQWGGKYPIYHNLPFLSVFTPLNLFNWSDCLNWPQVRPVELDGRDLARLKKTSIDYTLCDDRDKPLICIEFDGMQQGFNVGTTYHPRLPKGVRPDPWRKEITELKPIPFK